MEVSRTPEDPLNAILRKNGPKIWGMGHSTPEKMPTPQKMPQAIFVRFTIPDPMHQIFKLFAAM